MLLAALLPTRSPALADDSPVPLEVVDIAEVSMEELLSGMPLRRSVVTSTKTQQRAGQTPAVVTVVTSDEIQAHGWRCLADVLHSVPGFYDVYDLVTHNVGVRGVNGGHRAAGNVLKVMIDGHPVDYRPTTGNFFGEELVPIELVERIEIIRGPASALYGANAFLGVVNVITRTGKSLGRLHLVGAGGMVRRHPGFGGGVLMGYTSSAIDLVLGAQYLSIDRSGGGLPAVSPLRSARPGGLSQNDVARPRSGFVKLQFNDLMRGSLQLLASMQHLEAAGEFQDVSPLTHTTRLAMVNENYRLSHESTPTGWLTLRLSGHHFRAHPADDERLDIGHDEYQLVRSVGATGFGLSGEAQARVGQRFVLTGGLDAVREDHLLQTFSQRYRHDIVNDDGSLLIKQGSVIPIDRPGNRRVFRNVGAFIQGVLTLQQAWSLTGGTRVDLHNIYGARPSSRLGLVYAPPERDLSLKLLYGSSFKAPSAEQLYTQPMKVLDIQGNPDLTSQTAHTLELFAGFGLPGGRGEISMDAFATKVLGRVEYQQLGLFQKALNFESEWLVGAEVEGRLALSRSWHLRLASALARSISKSLGKTIPPGAPQVTNALYPVVQSHLLLDYALPWWGLRAATELSYIGSRASSQSNTLINGAAYQIPGYLVAGAALSRSGLKWFGNRQTNIALRISDLMNRRFIEPGFGGVDVPSTGLTTWLTIDQQF